MEIEISRITSKGQVVIPQEIRERKGIKEGERFLVFDSDDSIIFKRVKNLEAIKNLTEFENIFKSMWKTAKEKNISKKDVEKEIEKVRKEKA
jgi:AbrB family looped-hinge helix DNA binding protein